MIQFGNSTSEVELTMLQKLHVPLPRGYQKCVYRYVRVNPLILTKHRVQSNTLVCVTDRHVELHQFSITRRTVAVELSVRRVSLDSFSVELNC